MLSTLKREWSELRDGRPGTRFLDVHEAHTSSTASRWVGMVLGVVLLLAGIVALPLPGPGSLIIGLGVALIARESPRVARGADWVEVRLRKLWQWGRRRFAG